MRTIVLQTFYDDFRANLSLTALLDTGIGAHLIGEIGFGKKGGPIRLIVDENNFEDACKILEFNGEHLSFPFCPKCGSRSFEEISTLRGNTFTNIFYLLYKIFTQKKFDYKCKKCGYVLSLKKENKFFI